MTENKGDLISRDYLKNLAYTIEDKYCGEKQVVDLSDINNAPTVERPQGNLISREALKEDLRRFFPVEVLEGIEPKTLFAQIMHDIDNAPTVTPDKIQAIMSDYLVYRCEPQRPQGEWYYNYQNGWHCSICHEPVNDMPTVMGKANFAFCPNCGADLRGKEE